MKTKQFFSPVILIANLLNLVIQIVIASRPIHWIKNLSIFAAIIFSGLLFSEKHFTEVVWGFVAFGFATSATYLFNDSQDVDKDKNHPIKKNRPVASGRLTVTTAIFVSLFFAFVSLLIASKFNPLFFITVLSYILLQIGYSLGLKNIPTIDILIIATGFIIRVYSGAFIIDAHLSVWFLLCVISVALFLAAGKRRSELGVISNVSKTRESLTAYKKDLLNSYVTMFGNAAWMSWALFTFFESPQTTTPVWLILAELSRTTTISKLLMITIPVAIFGILRYEALIFEDKSETPEKVLLTDKSLTISIVLWITMVVYVIYGGVAINF